MSSYLDGCDVLLDGSEVVVGDTPPKSGDSDLHGGIYLIALILGAFASMATLVEFAMFVKRGRR